MPQTRTQFPPNLKADIFQSIRYTKANSGEKIEPPDEEDSYRYSFWSYNIYY